jgi:hypothetical protein
MKILEKEMMVLRTSFTGDNIEEDMILSCFFYI